MDSLYSSMVLFAGRGGAAAAPKGGRRRALDAGRAHDAPGHRAAGGHGVF